MDRITLKIESSYESKKITLDEELSIGRTDLADLMLEDTGLSRLNTTIFRDGDEVLVVDENSSNGTFLNGEKLGREPKILFDGDELSLGSETRIKISIGESSRSTDDAESETSFDEQKIVHDSTAPPTVQQYHPNINVKDSAKQKETPMVLIVAAGSTFLIVFLAVIGLLVANYFDGGKQQATTRRTPKGNRNAVIPIRVIDPLGAQKQEDMDDLAQFWEVQEEEIKVEDIQEIKSDTSANKTSTGFNLKVTQAFFKQQYSLTRKKFYGNDPPGRILRKELCCGVPKQTRKIGEMIKRTPAYQIPMDFADLARKRMSGELIELPMATNYWVLDVGGSSNKELFTTFDFKTKSTTALVGSDDYNVLAKLAANFDGEKYNMNNPVHRQQMKIRLLRMFHPSAKPVLERLSKAYYAKFNRPLRITSLSRSMEYQISLNKGNANSFRVRGAGSLPPHTSGCTFDLSRKFMSAAEQNFMTNMLADMENAGSLDGLREGNRNACFHVFIYDDGQPPR